ncbi:hypothetical protein [Sorangium sp. So ce426]|uniref:hypothetical protein n=1 Tax=unclassified Sorangium TaxID=2621164 RepID=UPI003F5AEFF8
MRALVLGSAHLRVILLAGARPALAQPHLWDSLTGGEIVDQEQPIFNNDADMVNGHVVGQVFIPQTD